MIKILAPTTTLYSYESNSAKITREIKDIKSKINEIIFTLNGLCNYLEKEDVTYDQSRDS